MLKYLCSVGALILLLHPASGSAQLAEAPQLTLSAAKSMATAAAVEAEANEWAVVITVVDAGGHLLYLERMDGVATGIVDIALGKARTAAAFGAPTLAFSEMLNAGRLQFLAVDGAIPIEGGVPIRVEGRVIGAIGVSGVTAEQDGIIAAAGVEALSTEREGAR
jgi:glc operon protein GlcG